MSRVFFCGIKNFQKDVHIKPIFPIYIVEGCERPEEWKDAHHIFPRSNGQREWIYDEPASMG